MRVVVLRTVISNKFKIGFSILNLRATRVGKYDDEIKEKTNFIGVTSEIRREEGTPPILGLVGCAWYGSSSDS